MNTSEGSILPRGRGREHAQNSLQDHLRFPPVGRQRCAFIQPVSLTDPSALTDTWSWEIRKSLMNEKQRDVSPYH